jgi:hypothetical protein
LPLCPQHAAIHSMGHIQMIAEGRRKEGVGGDQIDVHDNTKIRVNVGVDQELIFGIIGDTTIEI